jgi:hypothetical protein
MNWYILFCLWCITQEYYGVALVSLGLSFFYGKE